MRCDADMVLCGADEMDLQKTFECGQCFRWRCDGAGQYVGTIRDTVYRIWREGEMIRIASAISLSGTASENDEADDREERRFLRRYFDLDRDYSEINRQILRSAEERSDSFLKDAAAYASGLRMLRQAPFETLISFIVSANNNIPKIKRSLDDLCGQFGTCIGEYGGSLHFTFPAAKDLLGGEEAVKRVRAIGYRSRAVSEAAKILCDDPLFLERLKSGNASFAEASERLRELYGVGEKVAGCVALFGLGHDTAFPVDTWIKKVLKAQYGVENHYGAFVERQFPVYPGIVQQYLFFYCRRS